MPWSSPCSSRRTGWGFLLPTLTAGQDLDGQRDVVKNEKRQRVDNAPYQAGVRRAQRAPVPGQGHPYSWPVIGSMEDLSRRPTSQDVVEFFKTYYASEQRQPRGGRATSRVSEPTRTRRKMVRRNPARGQRAAARAGAGLGLSGGEAQDHQRATCSCHVSTWPGSTPALYAPGDAAMDMVSEPPDGGRKNSRLYHQHSCLRNAGGPGRDGDADVADPRQRRFMVVVTARPVPVAGEDPGGDQQKRSRS